MKSLIVVFVLALGMAFSVNAQDADDCAKEKKVEKKEHVCTDKCTAEKHVYACGEEGHVCTDACKKEHKKEKKMKKHVCTDKCTADNHVYACGEEGHKCTDACKKK